MNANICNIIVNKLEMYAKDGVKFFFLFILMPNCICD